MPRRARVWNDAASTVHRQHPQRFVVLATLPMLEADDAIAELERAAELPGVRGVYMGTNINGLDLDNPRFAPVFARIEQLGLPVFLHPQQTVSGNRLSNYFLRAVQDVTQSSLPFARDPSQDDRTK